MTDPNQQGQPRHRAQVPALVSNNRLHPTHNDFGGPDGALLITQPSGIDLATSPLPSESSSLPSTSPSSAAEPLRGRKKTQRKHKPGYIPRPPNPFIVFRSSWLKSNDGMRAIERDHRQLSRICGEVWRAMSAAKKIPYQRQAQAQKEAHARKYPDCRFSPQRRTEEIVRRKTKRNGPEDFLCISEVAKLSIEGKQGAELAAAVKTVDERIASEAGSSAPPLALKSAEEPNVSPALFSSLSSLPTLTSAAPHPSSQRHGGYVSQEQLKLSPLSIAPTIDLTHFDDFVNASFPLSPTFHPPAIPHSFGLAVYVPTGATSPLDDDTFPWHFSCQPHIMSDAQAALSAERGDLSDLLANMETPLQQQSLEGGLGLSPCPMIDLEAAYFALKVGS